LKSIAEKALKDEKLLSELLDGLTSKKESFYLPMYSLWFWEPKTACAKAEYT